MGGGGSKMGAEGVKLPPGIFSLLRRRYEEIRRRGNKRFALKGTTPSKKVLLSKHPDSNVVEGSEESSDSRHSEAEQMIVRQENAAPPPNEMPAANAMEVENSEEELLPKEERISIIKQENGDDEVEKNKKENEGEDFGPGSPSFRIYYLNSLLPKDNNNENDEEDHDDDDDGGKTESSDERTDDSATDTSKESNELRKHSTFSQRICGTMVSPEEEGETNKRDEKKRKKGKKLSKVLPKGRQVAIRSFRSMRSCYYSPCSSHDRTRLLAAKAVA